MKKILKLRTERGFTLLESLLVVGLSTLVAAGVVIGLMEGMDVLNEITDQWSVDHGHQRVSMEFMDDIHNAVWMYNGTVHDDGGGLVFRQTASPNVLILGYPTNDGDEIWIRWSVRPGAFSREDYLVRTVMTSSSSNQGTSILSSGMANFQLSYFDVDGTATDQIPEISLVEMTASININGATVQRAYTAALRNGELGIKEPPGDFDDIETQLSFK